MAEQSPQSIFRSIPACNRCRNRKTRCDTGRPSCTACLRTGSTCFYFDQKAKSNLSRQHICDLESQLQQLELEYQTVVASRNQNVDTEAASVVQFSSVDATLPRSPTHVQNASEVETSSNQANLIDIGGAQGEVHFLGNSSGLHIARAILESAQQNDADLEAFSEGEATVITQESSHLRQASLATLPSQDTARDLAQLFFSHFQIQYPILVEDVFLDEISILYSQGNNNNPDTQGLKLRFMITMVMAISLLSLSKDKPNAVMLAENYSVLALAYLPTIMSMKDAQALQCLLLMLLYSLLRQTKIPIWYISGLCTRMCVDLGLHSEKLILESEAETQRERKDNQIDNKRRLFWVTYTFDRTLSTVLGRPFTLPEDIIDVHYPDSTLPIDKRDQTIHWWKLQRLQSEMVLSLYRSQPTSLSCHGMLDNLTEFVSGMNSRLDDWIQCSLQLANEGHQDLDWWSYWYYNAVLFLHRPSSNGARSGSDPLLTCYDAAMKIIQLSFIRQNRKHSNFTWLDLQCQFDAGTTFLFAIWKSSEVRAKAKIDWTTVKSCFAQWEAVLEDMVKTWPKVGRARDILIKLKDFITDTVDKEIRSILPQRGKEGSRAKNVQPSSFAIESLLGRSRDNQSPNHNSESLLQIERDYPTSTIQRLPESLEESMTAPQRQTPMQLSTQNDESWTFPNMPYFAADTNGVYDPFSTVGDDLWRTWNVPLGAQQPAAAFGTSENSGNLGRGPYEDVATLADMDIFDPSYMDSILNFHSGY